LDGGFGIKLPVPKPPLPPDVEALLAKPNLAVIATVRPDGSPHSAVTWYLWEDGRALVNMDESRRRLEYMRRDPRVSLTVMADDGSHVTLEGRAATIEDDPRLEGIDRVANHNIGAPFPMRDRPRVNAWIEVDSWHRGP
jgi:PPOX class probable F420-dependent enzyme